MFVRRTAVQAVEQMRDNLMDLSFSGPTFTIMAKARFGLATKFISAGALRGSLGGRSGDFMNLIAANHVKIDKPADFEGKTLGAFALDGGITHCAPIYLFRKFGVDETRIKWKTMPFHQMPEALEAGEIDIAICVEPLVTEMQRRGLGHAVDEVLGGTSVALAATGNPSLVSNWWATADSVERHPELFEHTAEALAEAVDVIYEDPKAAMDAMAVHTGKDSSLLREIGFRTVFFHAFAANAPELRSMYEAWVKVLKGASLLDGDVDVEAFFTQAQVSG
nr:ABC transporter substrate-binding protein [Pusillimonas caeni]